MAITPSEAKKHMNQKEVGDLARLEKRIDDALREYDGGTVNIDVSILDTTPKVREKLLEKYRAAGWVVRLVGDPRDGNFYEFKEYERKSHSGPWD